MSQPFDAVPPPAPDWVAQTPAWPAPSPYTGPVPVPEPRRGTGGLVAAAAVGAAVLSAGVIVAALLSAVVLSSALTSAMEAQTEAMVGGGISVGGSTAVEQSAPVEPGVLGDDPQLDGYAADCFTGTLDACDQLFYESAPFSEYERYGSTCGGRIKPYTVAYCTDLE